MTPAVFRFVSPKARLTASPPERGYRFHTRAGPTNPCTPLAGSTIPFMRWILAISSCRHGLWSKLRSTAARRPPPTASRAITHRLSPTLATVNMSPRRAHVTAVDPLSRQSMELWRNSACCAFWYASVRCRDVSAHSIEVVMTPSPPPPARAAVEGIPPSPGVRVRVPPSPATPAASPAVLATPTTPGSPRATAAVRSSSSCRSCIFTKLDTLPPCCPCPSRTPAIKLRLSLPEITKWSSWFSLVKPTAPPGMV
mmetsp:Transcript_16954/g.41802  ORF Transcript_16954/g.41802 Transcript_16954/m.41802 type:complete len:254 (+) Transcript_16954:281-1042(+)